MSVQTKSTHANNTVQGNFVNGIDMEILLLRPSLV